MSLITSAQLLRMAPLAQPHIVSAIVGKADEVFAKYGLATLRRVQGFLSVCDEESGGFTVLSENLNYSAQRAHEVWPGIFPTVQAALPYAHNPEALANKAYGGRMGNTSQGDGWRYRGQGLPQITGRDNFTLLQRLTGLPLVDQPELVASDEHMLDCAVALFVRYSGILAYCDAGNFHAVWALVGSGSATGRIINLANHEAALAKVQAAVTALGPIATSEPSAESFTTAIAAAPSLKDMPFIEFGSADRASVKVLQAAINRIYLDSYLTVDGDFGPETRDAVLAFQRGHGLDADGMVGKATWAALKAAA